MSKSTVFSLAILVVVSAAEGSVSRYIGPTVGNSPETAMEFATEGYWQGDVPSGEAAEANFDSAAMGQLAAPLYFSLPAESSVGAVRGGGGKTVNLIGDTLTTHLVTYLNEYIVPAVTVYANLKFDSSGIQTLCAAHVYGDISGDGVLQVGSGDSTIDHACYANDASGVVVNSLPTNWALYGATLRIGAMRGADATKGLWTATKGSRFIRFAGQSIHTVAVGSSVSCPGVTEEGTFVKHWFQTEQVVELSRPTLDDAVATEFAFGAFAPTTRQSVTRLYKGDNNGSLYLSQWSKDDDAVVEIGLFEGEGEYASTMTLGCDGVWNKPWHVILHAAPFRNNLNLKAADLEFGANPDGLRGLPNARVQVSCETLATTTTSEISVPELDGEDEPAYLGAITSVVSGGRLLKKGSGTLVTQLQGEIAGTLEVAEGTLSITNADAFCPILVRSGATLDLRNMAVRMSSLQLEDGARLTGNATLVFTTAAEAEAFVVPDGMSVAVIGGGSIALQQMGADTGFAVAAGDRLRVIGTTGTGTFTKSGEGELELHSFGRPADDIVVKGGKLTLVSKPLEKSLVPDVWSHLDMSGEFNTFITSQNGDDVLLEQALYINGSGNHYFWPMSADADRKPKIRQVADCPIAGMNGKTVLDCGPQRFGSAMYSFSNGYGVQINPAAAKGSLRTIFWVIGSAEGGSVLIGGNADGYNDGTTIMRGGKFSDGDFSEKWNAPIANYAYPGRTFRVNGKVVDATKTGLSGDWDIVTMVDTGDGIGAKAFAQTHYQKFSGGQALAEVILADTVFTDEQVYDVESYLRKKWFGLENPGYAKFEASCVTLAPGSELKVEGPLGMTLTSVTGGGTISGSVRTEGPLDVTVTAKDGSVAPLTLNGADLDLSAGGTVAVIGDVTGLEPGTYELVKSAAVHAGDAWRLILTANARRSYSIGVADGLVFLTVAKTGMVITVK